MCKNIITSLEPACVCVYVGAPVDLCVVISFLIQTTAVNLMNTIWNVSVQSQFSFLLPYLIPTNTKACYWQSFIYNTLLYSLFHCFFFLISPSLLPCFSFLVLLHALPPRCHTLELHTFWWWCWWWWRWRKLRWCCSLCHRLIWTQWVPSHMCCV